MYIDWSYLSFDTRSVIFDAHLAAVWGGVRKGDVSAARSVYCQFTSRLAGSQILKRNKQKLSSYKTCVDMSRLWPVRFTCLRGKKSRNIVNMRVLFRHIRAINVYKTRVKFKVIIGL